MAKKKTKNQPKKKQVNAENVIGLHSEVTDQPITQTLEVNYMPYAMSVNVSRAFPEIDGFKPSHRKLLYTMYKMGLLKGERQKSANIVGQTMKLNPHGDAAIYETMVRLATGNEALLAPFVESKGNFGKYYSGDLSYAASRYTEAKLSPISAEIFKDIDKDPVDFVDSYDGAMKEPRLLPTTFPNILVSANKGIGVAMASDICGFNLNEVCTATMHFLQDPDCDLLEYMPMPDFSTGGEIIYRREEMEKIVETGLGSFQIRSRWRWIPEERIIEVYEIPYTTKTDVIIERIVKLSKEGKVKEIADIRDETDLSGLRIAIDLKRGVDPTSSWLSSIARPRCRIRSRATLTCWSTATPVLWACARSCTSGSSGVLSPRVAALTLTWAKSPSACTCCTASRRSCSTSTRPSPSFAAPSSRPKSCPTL